MDLDTIRKTLAEKETARERVGAEADELRAKLTTVSKAARAAEHRAEEAALMAVIDPTPSVIAAAETAKAVLVQAFEHETALRDRMPLLDRAVRVLVDEIGALEAKLPGVANAKVAEVITADLDAIDEQLVQVAGKLLARARAINAPTYEVADVVVDRLEGNGATRHGLRGRVLEAAARVRAEITAER